MRETFGYQRGRLPEKALDAWPLSDPVLTVHIGELWESSSVIS